MPVRLTQHVSICPEKDRKSDFNRLQTKNKSRMTFYLNTARTSDTPGTELSIFNETVVQNMLQEQRERKMKSHKRCEKLKLVWKRKYNPAKSPQEALNEFLAQRSTPRRLRFTTGSKGKPRYSAMQGRDSRETIKQKPSPAISVFGNSSNQYNQKDSSDLTSPKPLQKFPRKNAFSTSSTVAEGSWEEIPPVVNEVNTAPPTTTCYPEKRYSRSIFNSKKATGHQEHNLFSYRTERRRSVAKEPGIEKKVSSIKRKFSLFDALKVVQHEREKLVPELKNKVDVDTILRAYLSEQFLELNLQGPEADDLRRMYKAAILNQPLINNLIMKHPDMLPSGIFKDLVTYKKGFEAKPIYSPTVVKSTEGPWRQLCLKYLSSPSGTVLIELENDVPQYANFYKSLLEERFQAISIEGHWVSEQSAHVIRENLLHTTINLRIGRQNPGSTVRLDVLQIIVAAGRNDRLLRQLALTVEGWLDQLIKGLFSPFKSVREETCQVLCFMTSSYPVMRELYLSKYFDVVQDLSLTIIRAFDQHEDTFPEYYILLAHIIHYCPSRSIIECIIDRWTNFRCVGLILHWPRLLYYALRYWPDDALSLSNRLFCLRVTKTLETAIQRPLTAKVCRCALYYLQIRFHNVSHLFTINHNKESAQSSFMAARAQRCA